MSMKRILFVFSLFSIVSFSAFSQMNGDYNYSIAIRGYTMMQMPRILNETNSDSFTDAPLNGIMVKFNDNQISYRINGSFYNKSKRFFNNCETCGEANGKLTDYSFKIGFEKSFNYSRIQPYFAFDLGYRSNKFDGTLTDQKIEATKKGAVISPVLGLKINVAKQLSFFAEGNLDFFYSYERQEFISNSLGNERTLNKYYKTEFLLNPVSVGLQFYLGNIR